MNKVVWTEWDDLKIPSNIVGLSLVNTPINSGNFSEITFFVPKYEEGTPTFKLIEKMPNLEVLQLVSAGFEDALKYLKPGVILCNGRGIHNESTAELAVGLTISSLRNFPEFTRNQSRKTWVHSREQSLYGKRIGILGYGAIGSTVGRMLSGFKCEVIPISKTGKSNTFSVNHLDEILPTLDVLILILPLTKDSENLMNEKRLSLMKDGSLLVNVARGAIVDSEALIKELQKGRLRAALDVTVPQPLPSKHPLWDAPGVFISPHVGGNSSAFEPQAKKFLESQLIKYSKDQPLDNVVAVG